MDPDNSTQENNGQHRPSTSSERVMSSPEERDQIGEERQQSCKGTDRGRLSKNPPPGITSDSAYLTSNTLEGESVSSEEGGASPPRPHAAYGRGKPRPRRRRQKASIEIPRDDDMSDIVGGSSDELDSDIADAAAPPGVQLVSRSDSTVKNAGHKSSCSYSSSHRTGVKPLSPARALLGRLPSPTPIEKEGRKKVREARESARMRYPQAAKAVKVPKLALSAR